MQPSVHRLRGDALDARRDAEGARRCARSRGRSGGCCRSPGGPRREGRDEHVLHHRRGCPVTPGARRAGARDPGDERAVHVPESDLGPHRDELVGEEQAVLEHPLVDGNAVPSDCVASARAIEVRSAGKAGQGPSWTRHWNSPTSFCTTGLAPGTTMSSCVGSLSRPRRPGCRRIIRRSPGTVSLIRTASGHSGQGHERADLDVVQGAMSCSQPPGARRRRP